jgi:hypothetical protein
MGSRSRANPLIIEALADGLTDAKTAEKAGVSVKTVRRRRQDPEIAAQVRQLINERRRERYRRQADVWDAGERLNGAAVMELARLMTSSRSDVVRVQAARALLQQFGPEERPEPGEIELGPAEPQTLADLFEGGVGDATLVAVTRERFLGVRVPVDLPRAPEPEPELARVIALPPADGLTDLERDELMKRGLYREGVPAAVQREVLRRAGWG